MSKELLIPFTSSALRRARDSALVWWPEPRAPEGGPLYLVPAACLSRRAVKSDVTRSYHGPGR